MVAWHQEHLGRRVQSCLVHGGQDTDRGKHQQGKAKEPDTDSKVTSL